MNTNNKLLIIISDQRFGSTTLCQKINDLPKAVNLFELFNLEQGRLGDIKPEDTCSSLVELIKTGTYKQNKNTKKLNQSEIISFKIFSRDSRFLKPLLECDMDKEVIFLRRNYEESYTSLKKALLTGNWGTTPELQATGSGICDYTKPLEHIITPGEYVKKMNLWFSFAEQQVYKYKIPYKILWFGALINPGFDVNHYV